MRSAAHVRTRDRTTPPTEVGAAPEVDWLTPAIALLVTGGALLTCFGLIFQLGALRTAGVVAMSFFGPGGLVLAQDRRMAPGLRVVLTIITSFALMVLVGGVMVFTRVWEPMPVGIVAGIAVVAGHLVLLYRWLVPGEIDALRGWYRTHRPELRGVATAPVVMAAVGAVLCLGSALVSQHLQPTSLGLVDSLPAPWYVGLGLLAVAVGLAREERGPLVLLLVAVLGLTVAIVYPEARYPYAAKHGGVTEYIRHFGEAHASIDIYQAWPAFFAGLAWLCDLANIGLPLSIARWWPIVIDLLDASLIRYLASWLNLSPRRCWMAAFLFFAANAIGQDYFSPQSAGFVFAAALYVLFLVPDAVRSAVLRWTLIVGLSLALAATHQITPYLVALALGVLVVFRQLRPFWSPAVPAVPAAIYAGTRISDWYKYVKPSQVGGVTHNVALPDLGGIFPQAEIVWIGGVCLLVGGVVVAALGVAGALQDRSRQKIAVLAAAGSPIVLLLGTAYGGEGINRALLFALPWLGMLAASVAIGQPLIRRAVSVVLSVGLTGTFFLATSSLDSAYTYTPKELAVEQVFEYHAPPGSYLYTPWNDNIPQRSTWRYTKLHFAPFFPLITYRGYRLTERGFEATSVLLERKSRGKPVYLFLSPSGINFALEFGETRPYLVRALTDLLERSPHWELVAHSGGTALYRLLSV